MVFGPSERDHDSPKQMILNFGYTKQFQIVGEHPESSLKHIIYGILKLLKIKNHFFGRDMDRHILKSRLSWTETFRGTH